jgi:hypothetical protein
MSWGRILAVGEIILALTVWGVGLWGVAVGQAYIVQWLYFFAWYPYIRFLDGLLYWLKGESWLISRPRDLMRMFFWSVTVWLVFEAFNLVLRNWGYIGVEPTGWVRWSGYAMAFATVLPGVLLTAEVLAALGAWRHSRGRPRDLANWQPFSLLAGMVMLVLPLIYPQYAFALVWGAFFFLLDPFSDLLGGKSLIRSFGAGERREFYCLLTAGLFCGLWWEAWNYLSSTKWVYTLPMFQFWKVFEMPLLGYLGFLPFALECAVMYNFLDALEKRLRSHPRSLRLAYCLHIAFWLALFAAMDRWTVISFR